MASPKIEIDDHSSWGIRFWLTSIGLYEFDLVLTGCMNTPRLPIAFLCVMTPLVLSRVAKEPLKNPID